MFCSGFESETDTEEFEKVGQSPIDRQLTDTRTMATSVTTVNATATATTFYPKPETTSMSTSTEQVVTQDSATLTEVRLNSKPESISNMMMTGLTLDNRFAASRLYNEYSSLTTAKSNPIPFSSPSESSAIRNPKRIDINSVLSPIPECDSPISNHPNGDCDCTTSETSTSIGICEKFRTSDFQSCIEDGDSEFVNSEFYIDESLPSSMTSSDQLPATHPEKTNNTNVDAMDIGDDLQQLIAEIDIISFDSCRNNDDRIIMVLQVLPSHNDIKKTKQKQTNNN